MPKHACPSHAGTCSSEGGRPRGAPRAGLGCGLQLPGCLARGRWAHPLAAAWARVAGQSAGRGAVRGRAAEDGRVREFGRVLPVVGRVRRRPLCYG